MPANQSGSVLLRWERTPRGIELRPFYSSMESAPTFRRITDLLKRHGGGTHLRVEVTTDDSILLSNLLLRDPRRCTKCGGLMLGPQGLSVCSDCQHVERQDGPPSAPVQADTEACPECGMLMVWRGVATVCTNCGYSTCPC